MLTSLRNHNRRTKEKLRQTFGLSHAADDSDFETAHHEYKNTTSALRSIQETMRSHVRALKSAHETGAMLAAELAAFHHDTQAADMTKDVSNAFANLDALFAGVERLYEEEIPLSVDLLLCSYGEVEERVKRRKTLILDLQAFRRKLDAAQNSFSDTQNNSIGSGNLTSGLRWRKNDDSVNDLAERKIRVEQTEAKLETETTWLLDQFSLMAGMLDSGKILDSSIRALVACEHTLARRTTKSFEVLASELANPTVVDTIVRYETDLAPGAEEAARRLLEVANARVVGNNSGKSDPHRAAANVPNNHQQGRQEVLSSFGHDSASSSMLTEEIGGGPPIELPPLVLDCIAFINPMIQTEGIFRIPGSNEVVNDLYERYDSGETDVLASVRCDVHDVASLFKLYLRNLTNGLFGDAGYRAAVDIALIAQAEPQEANRGPVVCNALLPHVVPKNSKIVAALLAFLQRVARHSDANKMTTTNLATCFAHSVFRVPQMTDAKETMKDVKHILFVFSIMIDNAGKFSQIAESFEEPQQQQQQNVQRSKPSSGPASIWD